MDNNDDIIQYVTNHTQILRLPKQTLSTFGVTNIKYYLVTEPAYAELVKDNAETVIREGKVIADRPRIVTPYYLSRLEGFSSDARSYFKKLLETYGANAPGLFYTYKNEPKELTIASEKWPLVVDKLNAEIDRTGDPLTSIIKGEDELWDVSLLKFIYEMTRRSLNNNLTQLGAKGLLDTSPDGIPVEARVRIEELFTRTYRGECQPHELENELVQWGVFEEYQDRFFSLFRKR